MTAPRKGLAKGVVVDPCTPRGYVRTLEENSRHSATVSTATHSTVSSIVSHGNFSECRTAAYSLLQNGHGNNGFKSQMQSSGVRKMGLAGFSDQFKYLWLLLALQVEYIPDSLWMLL